MKLCATWILPFRKFPPTPPWEEEPSPFRRQAKQGFSGAPGSSGLPAEANLPCYETVRPSPEVIAHLRAKIEGYMFVALPLVENGTVTADQIDEMPSYALNAEHGSTPEREFSDTAGDVGNDLLKFVETAQGVLNPGE